jgi:hypothetical protein
VPNSSKDTAEGSPYVKNMLVLDVGGVSAKNSRDQPNKKPVGAWKS